MVMYPLARPSEPSGIASIASTRVADEIMAAPSPWMKRKRMSRSVRAATDHIISPGPARCRKIGGHERRDTPEACDAGAELGSVGRGRRDRHAELHHAGGGRLRLPARHDRQGVRAGHSAPA